MFSLGVVVHMHTHNTYISSYYMDKVYILDERHAHMYM